MKQFWVIILMVAALGMSGITSFAQEAGQEDGVAEEGQEEWMALWTRVQKIRLEEMKASLRLTDETMDRLAPPLTLLDQKKRAIGKERLSLLRELKKLKNDKAREAQLQAVLNRLEANHAALEAVKQETKAHLAAHLTPAQQAQYIFFQREFNERLRGLIQKERQRGGQGRRLP